MVPHLAGVSGAGRPGKRPRIAWTRHRVTLRTLQVCFVVVCGGVLWCVVVCGGVHLVEPGGDAGELGHGVGEEHRVAPHLGARSTRRPVGTHPSIGDVVGLGQAGHQVVEGVQGAGAGALQVRRHLGAGGGGGGVRCR